MRAQTLSAAEKATITAACQAFIDTVLKPRFLPVITPTQFNYPVDIQGKWHGSKYRFLQRYRSGFADNLGEEFDAPFTRIDWMGRDRFDVHTEQPSCAWAAWLEEIEGIKHVVVSHDRVVHHGQRAVQQRSDLCLKINALAKLASPRGFEPLSPP